MGSRFGRSVQLAPGMRMNFSGSREVDALGEIHLASPSPHGRPTLHAVPFSLPEPLPPTLVQKGFWDKVLKSRWQLKELQNKLALERFEAEAKEWLEQAAEHRAVEEIRRRFLERDLVESHSAMEKYLEASLQQVQWPRETHVSFDVSADGSSVMLDVEVPEIEEMPAGAARQGLYVAHVHGVGFRIIAESFAALPTLRQVTLSAYSQVRDEYLYAVRVGRGEWEQINFAELGALDVVEALARFDMRRNMTKTGSFSPVTPFGQGEGACA
jgi:hypothetical protein